MQLLEQVRKYFLRFEHVLCHILVPDALPKHLLAVEGDVHERESVEEPRQEVQVPHEVIVPRTDSDLLPTRPLLDHVHPHDASKHARHVLPRLEAQHADGLHHIHHKLRLTRLFHDGQSRSFVVRIVAVHQLLHTCHESRDFLDGSVLRRLVWELQEGSMGLRGKICRRRVSVLACQRVGRWAPGCVPRLVDSESPPTADRGRLTRAPGRLYDVKGSRTRGILHAAAETRENRREVAVLRGFLRGHFATRETL